MIGTLREGPPVSPGTTVIAVACGILLAFVALDGTGAVRPLALPFLLVVPGLALTRAAGFRTSPASLSLAVVLSAGVTGAVALALVAVGRLEPLLAAILVVAVTLAALLVDESLRRVRPAVDAGAAGAPAPDVDRTHREPAL